MKSPYDILGLKEGASYAEIKKAYRNLAKIYHPDNKETGDDARFREINEAYEEITNPKPKNHYTNNGSQSFDEVNEMLRRHGFRGMGGFGFEPQLDIDVRFQVSLEDLENGYHQKVTFWGNDEIEINLPKGYDIRKPYVINGKGKTATINGKKIVGHLNIHIIPELTDGISQLHNTVDGVTIVTPIVVHYFESLIGLEKELVTPYGKTIRVKIPKNFTDKLLKVDGHGMMNGDKRLPWFIYVNKEDYDISLDDEDLSMIKTIVDKHLK